MNRDIDPGLYFILSTVCFNNSEILFVVGHIYIIIWGVDRNSDPILLAEYSTG
jgi:hypothetical protein